MRAECTRLGTDLQGSAGMCVLYLGGECAALREARDMRSVCVWLRVRLVRGCVWLRVVVCGVRSVSIVRGVRDVCVVARGLIWCDRGRAKECCSRSMCVHGVS